MTYQLESRDLADAIRSRRSVRKVTNSPAVDRARVEEAIRLALHSPTAFSMQSGRVVVLTGQNHHELWDLTSETLRPFVPAENFAATAERLQGFRNGAGTVLFFEDQNTVQNMQNQFALYKDNFPRWSEHGSAMLQYAVWLSLSAEGLGASLQHYNPLIDDQVKAKWGLPSEWTLVAQMPFGVPDEQPTSPTYLPVEEVVKWL